MATVRTILEKKGTHIWSVSPSTSVFDTLQLMAARNIGAVLVLEGDVPVGIFSERDYVRQCTVQRESFWNIPVEKIMTSPVVLVRPDQTIEECMALMTEKRIRHLPVLENGKIVGVISIGDVVKEMISHQQFIISQLENYITGKR